MNISYILSPPPNTWCHSWTALTYNYSYNINIPLCSSSNFFSHTHLKITFFYASKNSRNFFSNFFYYRRKTLQMLVGRMRMAFRKIRWTDATLQKAYRSQAVQVSSLWPMLFAKWSSRTSHEKTHLSYINHLRKVVSTGIAIIKLWKWEDNKVRKMMLNLLFLLNFDAWKCRLKGESIELIIFLV